MKHSPQTPSQQRKHKGSWTFLQEDRERVVQALAQGKCDGMLPAAVGLFDHFVAFLVRHQVLDLLPKFPDRRERRSIASVLLCRVMLFRMALRIKSYAHTSQILFHSPDAMRRLGFNARQINEGFYRNCSSPPFGEEALCDYFAKLTFADLFRHQQSVLRHLRKQFPQLLEEGEMVMDGIQVPLPRGQARSPSKLLRVVVLALRHHKKLYPVLWNYRLVAKDGEGELPQGKALIRKALQILGPGTLRRLLVDRGYLDGTCFRELKDQGIDVVCGVRSDMDLYADLQGLAKLQGVKRIKVSPPKVHQNHPRKREVFFVPEPLETLSTYGAPVTACLVRDTYEKEVKEYVCFATDTTLWGRALYDRFRSRWDLEELFMDLTRYWRLEDYHTARDGLAASHVHFVLLTFTLFHLLEEEENQKADTPSPAAPLPLAGREITVYYQDCYAIFYLSELLQIIFDHLPVWQQRLPDILINIKLLEGSIPPHQPHPHTIC